MPTERSERKVDSGTSDMNNVDLQTVDTFRREWSMFDQTGVPLHDLETIFHAYFRLFPWEQIGKTSVGFDVGCGTGRWARFVAPRVAELHCVEPDRGIIAVAQRNLSGFSNCRYHEATANDMPIADQSMDFGYAIGVLHYIPDPLQALRGCVAKLKVGAPMLVSVYYALDNRPVWYRLIWRIIDCTRRIVSRLPFPLIRAVSFAIALFVYYPLARFALSLEKAALDPHWLPLSEYRHRQFYTMRNDSLNRFSNRLEHRFTRRGLAKMMEQSGLEAITVSTKVPYWNAVGYKGG